MARNYVLSYHDERNGERHEFFPSSNLTRVRRAALPLVYKGLTVHILYKVTYSRKAFDFDYVHEGSIELHHGYPCWYTKADALRIVKPDGSLGKTVSVFNEKLRKWTDRK